MIQEHFLGADSFAYFSNNVHVFNFTECACVQFYRMCMCSILQNVHVFNFTECACVQFYRMCMCSILQNVNK